MSKLIYWHETEKYFRWKCSQSVVVKVRGTSLRPNITSHGWRRKTCKSRGAERLFSSHPSVSVWTDFRKRTHCMFVKSSIRRLMPLHFSGKVWSRTAANSVFKSKVRTAFKALSEDKQMIPVLLFNSVSHTFGSQVWSSLLWTTSVSKGSTEMNSLCF